MHPELLQEFYIHFKCYDNNSVEISVRHTGGPYPPCTESILAAIEQASQLVSLTTPENSQ